MTKEDARTFQKNRILNIQNRKEKEEKIQYFLLAKIQFLKKVICYRSDKWEVNVDSIWNNQNLKNIDFYFPSVVSIVEKKMEFVLPDYWEKGKFGIMEPRGNHVIAPDEADMSIIPSLGFQKDGYRLGRGGGFYDRAFSGVDSKKMIGIGFSEFFSIDFTSSDYDIRVGELVTDSGSIFF